MEGNDTPRDLDDLSKDRLFVLIRARRDGFKNEAVKHKSMNRALWGASTVASIGVATGTALHDLGAWIPPLTVALSIALPALNAYIAFRSPEQLWILETSVRNRLSDLLTEMELLHARQQPIDRERIQAEFLRILGGANDEWLASKRGK